MPKTSSLPGNERKELTKDQEAVLKAYFGKDGRVCVDAGAGTGKTTTLIETLANIVVEEIKNHQSENPMERILAVSFGVEASRQLKTALRKRLRDCEEAGVQLSQNIWRYIECESHIQTIDAFMQSLLREIALKVGISPAFEVPSGLEQDQIVEETLARILRDQNTAQKWRRLSTAFPPLDYLEFAPENLKAMVWNSHQKSREFCMEIDLVRKSLVDSVKKIIHSGKSPPFTIQDLKEIVEKLSNRTYTLSCQPDSEGDLVIHAEDVYATSLQLAEDFGDILVAFDSEYNKLTREEGWLTYIDVAYLVWKYTMRGGDKDWIASLQNRFDHILVDEFQDTSFVQFEVIKSLIRPGNPPSRNHVMLIGDVKQSIYQWRSAEPQIFAAIIRSTKQPHSKKESPLEGMIHRALVSNFRSHPYLIDLFNGVFSNIFSDEARGAISGEVPYTALKFAQVHETSPFYDSTPRVHIFLNNERTVGQWVSNEAQRMSEMIRTILDPAKSKIKIRDKDSLRTPQAGDIALLFRRSRNIPNYVEELRASGIKCTILTDISLFGAREVSLIIDFLDWLANPESRESITRILRSPLVALSDKTLRYLASEGFLLIRALRKWNASLDLPEEDKARLEDLLRLRNDLRWDREGPKAALVEKIIAGSCFDSIVLTSEKGVQAQANLWMLIEVLSSWEDEELLPYRDLVETIKELRERAWEGIERDYPRAVLADERSRDSVKIMTIHAAKGLEFPIVVIPESIVHVFESSRTARMVRSRKIGMILKPRASRIALPAGVLIARGGRDRGIAWASRGREESILWLSPVRDALSGVFTANTPLNDTISDAVAEFWRILYVAATRAKDHLIFSCGDKWTRYEWNSWMRFLRKSLRLEDVNPGIHRISLSWKDEKSKSVKREVKIGIEDIPPSPELQPSPFSPQTHPTGTASGYEDGCPSFVPSRINPSTFPTIVECPRRYQYETVWRTSGLRIPTAATGANPPRRMSAEEWGRRVHEVFASRDYSTRFDADKRVLDLLSQYQGKLRIELERALENFSKLPISKTLMDAATQQRTIFPERTLNSLLTSMNPPLLVEGRLDLLFNAGNEGWLLIDFKAEEEPEIGSYRDRIHKGQMDAYAWLVEKALGLKIGKAFLAYIHPNASQREHTPNAEKFEAFATSKLGSLFVDSRGLKAEYSSGPKGTCLVCPFSDNVGGPCDH